MVSLAIISTYFRPGFECVFTRTLFIIDQGSGLIFCVIIVELDGNTEALN